MPQILVLIVEAPRTAGKASWHGSGIVEARKLEHHLRHALKVGFWGSLGILGRIILNPGSNILGFKQI